VKNGALNIVVGVNDHLYEARTHHPATAASCTTNCLAPVVKVLHESIGIKHGVITTVRSPRPRDRVGDPDASYFSIAGQLRTTE
jgi:glyceraldehyde-3-phosphate dehydrogenase/erythrose-4-phosphate dehydrogenase